MINTLLFLSILLSYISLIPVSSLAEVSGNTFVEDDYESSKDESPYFEKEVPVFAKRNALKASSSIRTSTKGQEFIKAHEGYHSKAYDDGFGNLTIGWGHTSGVKAGMTVTKAEAQELFEQDLRKKEALVNKYENQEGIRFTQQQYDALVSLVFNLSTNPLGSNSYRITKAIKKYQSGTSVNIPTDKVWECFAVWHHAGGVDVKGLYNRRMNEARMFSMANYTRKTDWKPPSWLKNGSSGPDVPAGWVPEEYKSSSMVPGKPAVTSVTANSSTSLTVKWKAVSGATSYEIRRKKSGDGEGWEYYKKVGTATGTSYKDTGLEPGTRYIYGIVAINSAGGSGNPGSDNRKGTYTLTDKPKVTSVTALSSSQLKVKWSAVSGATSYEIYRRKSGEWVSWEETYQKIGTATGTEYTDSGLQQNTMYHYGIVAINGAGVGSGNPGSANRSNGTTKVAGAEMTSGYDRVLPDGDYMIVSAANPQYYLDIAGGDAVAPNKTNVQLYGPASGNLSASDTWTITYKDGFYTICQKNSSASLDVYGGNRDNNANISAWQKNDNSSQKWAISINSGKGYRIQSKCSGMSVDIYCGTIAAGTNIQQYAGNTSDAQRWLFIPYQPGRPVADGRYVLVTGLNPHVEMDVPGNTGDIADGTSIQIWNDGTNSRYNSFDLKYIGDGYYNLIHAASGKYVGVKGATVENYGDIQLSAPDGSNSQKWCLKAQNGGYMLVNKHSGLTIDVDNGKTADATNVRQHYYNGSKAQTWVFKQAEHTVKYDANGGTGAPAAQTKYYANALTLSSSKPAYTNRIFKGWATKKDAAAAEYQPGASYTADSDVTLYAVWEEEKPVATGVRIRKAPGKTEYIKGESLETAGLEIEVTYSNGTSKTVTSGFTCMPNVLDKAGTQTITVTCEGKTTTFDVTVKEEDLPGEGEGKVTGGTVNGSVGATVALPINLEVNPGIVGISLDMEYDSSRLKLVKVESGQILDGSSMVDDYTKNPYRLSLSNDMSKTGTEGTGLLATAYFEVLKGEQGDTIPVKLTFKEAYDKDLNEVTFKTTDGKIRIASYIPGDVNRDGEVKLNDAIILRRYVAGWNLTIDELAADVNRDGEVKLNDAIILRRYVAGWDVVLK